MNKFMILSVLVAYNAFNDASLTIVTDEDVYNNVVVDDIYDTFVKITCDYDDSHSYLIKLDSITGIQFRR